MCICVYICIYRDMHIERERERDVYIIVYTYVHILRERERERVTERAKRVSKGWPLLRLCKERGTHNRPLGLRAEARFGGLLMLNRCLKVSLNGKWKPLVILVLIQMT